MAAPILFIVGQAGIAAARYAAPHVARGAVAVARTGVEAGKAAFRFFRGGSSAAPGVAQTAQGVTSAAVSGAGRAAGQAASVGGTVAAMAGFGRTAGTAAVSGIAGAAGSMVGSTASRVAGVGLTIAGAVYLLNEARSYLAAQVGGPEDMRRRMQILGPQPAGPQNAGMPAGVELSMTGGQRSAASIGPAGAQHPTGVAFEVVREGRRISMPVPGSQNIANPAERLRFAEEWWSKNRAEGKIAYDLQPGDRMHMFNGEAGREIYSRGNDGRFGFDRSATSAAAMRDGTMFRSIDTRQTLGIFASEDAGRSLIGNALSVEPERLGPGRSVVGSGNGARAAMAQSPDDPNTFGMFALSGDGKASLSAVRSSTDRNGRSISEYTNVDLGREVTPGPDGKMVVSDEAQRRASLVGQMSRERNPLTEFAQERSGTSMIQSVRHINPTDPAQSVHTTTLVGGTNDQLHITARQGQLSMHRLDRAGQPISEPVSIKDNAISVDREGRLSLSPNVRQSMDQGIAQMGFTPDVGAARSNLGMMRPDPSIGMAAGPRSLDAGMGR
jgi:hypothetical protein